MSALRTFWQNLSKAQKVGVVLSAQIIVIILMISMVHIFIQPKNHINIANENDFGLQIPNKNITMFKNELWSVISKNAKDVDTSVLNDVVIRQDSYQETETEVSHEANFIVDIDSIKQTYKVTISWAIDPKSGLYDDVVVDCPPQSAMKYSETICYGMYNNTYSLDLYLPYEVSSPYAGEYDIAAPDIYIDGDEFYHTITVTLTPCNTEENKQKALKYLESTPLDLSTYKITYEVNSLEAVCKENLQNGL